MPVPSEPISIDTATTKGSLSAPVVLIAFVDFQCPFCGRFAREVLPEIDQEYIRTGRVQLVYRHLPLPSHPHASGAAEAAACAAKQGQFWPMHDRLFAGGAQLDDAGLRAIAGSLALDRAAFDACLETKTTLASVSRDAEEARTLALRSTPSFLLGTRLPDGRVQVVRVFAGARPIDEFRAEIDRVLDPGRGFVWGTLLRLRASLE